MHDGCEGQPESTGLQLHSAGENGCSEAVRLLVLVRLRIGQGRATLIGVIEQSCDDPLTSSRSFKLLGMRNGFKWQEEEAEEEKHGKRRGEVHAHLHILHRLPFRGFTWFATRQTNSEASVASAQDISTVDCLKFLPARHADPPCRRSLQGLPMLLSQCLSLPLICSLSIETIRLSLRACFPVLPYLLLRLLLLLILCSCSYCSSSSSSCSISAWNCASIFDSKLVEY